MDRTIWELLEVTFEFVVLVNSGQELGVAELSPLYMTEDDPGEWFPFWTQVFLLGWDLEFLYHTGCWKIDIRK